MLSRILFRFQLVTTLRTATQKLWGEFQKKQLPNFPYSLRVINRQLAYCSGAGVTFLDTNLSELKTFHWRSLGLVSDVAELSSGDLVIAAENGLFHADSKGNE